ncbi:MAG: hypothetical protein AB8B66_00915 [Rickettsiaceae bacterium]
MLKKMVIFILLPIFLTACTKKVSEDLYSSGYTNRKVFKDGRRSPLYNKKYIAQAKKNVRAGDYEIDDDLDDDFSEEENISKDNVEMYKAMIKEEQEAQAIGSKKQKNTNNNIKGNLSYPSLAKSRCRTDPEIYTQHLELKGELEQVKLELKETRQELMQAHKTNSVVQDKDKKKNKPVNVKGADKKIPPKNTKKKDSSSQEAVKSI